jgi:hypothetical protein
MKAPIAQSGALPGNAKDISMGAFIGLCDQKLFKNNSDLGWVLFNGQLRGTLYRAGSFPLLKPFIIS